MVNALFHTPEAVSHLSTYLGYAETEAILRRRFNAGELNIRDYNVARMVLEAEVLGSPEWQLLSVTDADILAGMALTDTYNLNCTDSALLTAFQRYARSAPDPQCLVIASDRRLLRAAAAEGFRTLDPEVVTASGIPAMLQDS